MPHRPPGHGSPQPATLERLRQQAAGFHAAFHSVLTLGDPGRGLRPLEGCLLTAALTGCLGHRRKRVALKAGVTPAAVKSQSLCPLQPWAWTVAEALSLLVLPW